MSEVKVKRMTIPNQSWGGRLGCGCGTAVLMIGTTLAISYLIGFRNSGAGALIAAILWLLWWALAFSIWMHDDGGPRTFLLRWLGIPSRSNFVEAARHPEGIDLQFAYMLFGTRINVFRVPIDAVIGVTWGPAYYAGNSPSDVWCISLWYNTSKSIPFDRNDLTSREKAAWRIGYTRPPSDIEAYADTFIQFLRDVGIDLKAIGDSREFTITGETMFRSALDRETTSQEKGSADP